MANIVLKLFSKTIVSLNPFQAALVLGVLEVGFPQFLGPLQGASPLDTQIQQAFEQFERLFDLGELIGIGQRQHIIAFLEYSGL